MVLVGIAGIAALPLGWHIVARTLFVPFQVPGLISGGLAGIALLGSAALLLNAQLERHASARRSEEIDALLDEAAALVAAAANRRGRAAPKRRRTRR